MARDRLSAPDAGLLRLEDRGVLTHVGMCLRLRGTAPDYDAFRDHVERVLPRAPRYRQALAFPPLGQGRAVWADDPHFNLAYHVRHTALPPPAGDAELRELAGTLLAQRLDRAQPLWELWLVERVGEDEFALLAKTHPALVARGRDLVWALLEPAPAPPPAPWSAAPAPSRAELLVDAIAQQATVPADTARVLAWALHHPAEAAERARRVLGGVTRPAPPSPLNVPVGPHRRFAWAQSDLGRVEAIASACGATVRDVVLAAVAGALRTHHAAHGALGEETELTALVPVEDREGPWGVHVPLLLAAADPLARLAAVARSVPAGAGAPPELLYDAPRLQATNRAANLTVTFVAGPAAPGELLNRPLAAAYPQVPLPPEGALSIAAMTVGDRVQFGLVGDKGALRDLDAIAAGLDVALAELATAAGVGNGRLVA